MKEKYQLTLSYSDDSILKIIMKNEQKKKYTFELSLFQMEDSPMVPPEAKPDAYFEMESVSFLDTLKNLENIFGGTEVTIEVKENYCVFKTKGEIGSVEYVEILDVISAVKPINMKFSLKYLLMFAKATNFHDTVKVIMFEEEPIQIRYEMKNDCYLGFFLAPRFADD
jgi:proliferating cell nuclear antigen PCNA